MESARVYGISENRAVIYHSDCVGTKTVYRNISDVMCSARESGVVEDDWKAKIDEDFKNRK